ncbi:hypothetical protein OAE68_01035 [Synechococcus sp. AH-551-A10]|nr:hypothetical protein [Synechococcus sp. AH-551-A10]
MAEVMSMLPDENAQGELNSDEQESLAIGEEMANDQETMLAGKYKNAEELEAAYIELQKKLGDNSEESEVTEEETEEEEESTDSSLFDRLWDEAKGEEFSEDILKELSESNPTDLAKMYLDFRNSQPTNKITEKDATTLMDSIGGEEKYSDMMKWAIDNVPDAEIDMYDSVMESGDRNAAFFAMQALSYKYGESVGVEGKLVQGKAPTDTVKGFKSQAEVVNAMQDPRYDRDPAYRQEIMAKLESSNVNF